MEWVDLIQIIKNKPTFRGGILSKTLLYLTHLTRLQLTSTVDYAGRSLRNKRKKLT